MNDEAHALQASLAKLVTIYEAVIGPAENMKVMLGEYDAALSDVAGVVGAKTGLSPDLIEAEHNQLIGFDEYHDARRRLIAALSDPWDAEMERLRG